MPFTSRQVTPDTAAQWESPRRKIYRLSVAGVGAVQVDEHYVGTAGRLILQVGGEAADSGSRAMTEKYDQSADRSSRIYAGVAALWRPDGLTGRGGATCRFGR